MDKTKSISMLLEEKKVLCEKIIALAERKYPINSQILFKTGNMQSHQAARIKSVVSWWWTSAIPEIIVINERTRKTRRICYTDLHEKYRR